MKSRGAERDIQGGITFLYVSDLSRSADFYGVRLGLELVLDQGACRIYRLCGGSYLGICRGDSGGKRTAPGGEGVIITLVVADVDRWYSELSGAGVEIEAEPEENERFEISHFFLRDPDGYLVEIQRFWDPTWSEPLEQG